MVGECMGEWGELLSCPSPASKCQRDKEASSPTHETPGHSMGFPSRKGEEGAKRSILQAGVRLGQRLKPQTMEALSQPRVGVPTP